MLLALNGKILTDIQEIIRKRPQLFAQHRLFHPGKPAPLRDDILKCLDNRPSVLQAKSIGKRILEKIKIRASVRSAFLSGMFKTGYH